MSSDLFSFGRQFQADTLTNCHTISFGKANQHILRSINLETPFRKNEGLIFTDKKLEAYSCYVELHRKSKSNTGELSKGPFYRDPTRTTSKC